MSDVTTTLQLRWNSASRIARSLDSFEDRPTLLFVRKHRALASDRTAGGGLGGRLAGRQRWPAARPMFESLLPARPVPPRRLARLTASEAFRWSVCIASMLLVSGAVGLLVYLVWTGP